MGAIKLVILLNATHTHVAVDRTRFMNAESLPFDGQKKGSNIM